MELDAHKYPFGTTSYDTFADFDIHDMLFWEQGILPFFNIVSNTWADTQKWSF
jgi:hypothetical protein